MNGMLRLSVLIVAFFGGGLVGGILFGMIAAIADPSIGGENEVSDGWAAVGFVAMLGSAAGSAIFAHRKLPPANWGPSAESVGDARQERRRADGTEHRMRQLEAELVIARDEAAKARADKTQREREREFEILSREDARTDPRWLDGETGKRAMFQYMDRWGELTERTVRNWRSDGPHIVAWCEDRTAERTFRTDRIDDWVAS